MHAHVGEFRGFPRCLRGAPGGGRTAAARGDVGGAAMEPRAPKRPMLSAEELGSFARGVGAHMGAHGAGEEGAVLHTWGSCGSCIYSAWEQEDTTMSINVGRVLRQRPRRTGGMQSRG